MTNRAAPPRRQPLDRSNSPWLAAALAIVVLALAAILIVPGLLGRRGPGPSAGGARRSASRQPSASPRQPTFVRPTPSPHADLH